MAKPRRSGTKRYLKDPGIELSDGTVLRLPAQLDAVELSLPGNHREFRGGIVALYDPTSCTGMVYARQTRRWTMLQPIGRKEFDDALAIGDQVQDGFAGSGGLTSTN